MLVVKVATSVSYTAKAEGDMGWCCGALMDDDLGCLGVAMCREYVMMHWFQFSFSVQRCKGLGVSGGYLTNYVV